MAHIPKLLFGRSSLNRERLKGDLCKISDSVFNKEQVKLYAARATQLRGQRSGLKKIRSEQIRHFAERLLLRITQVSSPDVETRHKELIEIIRDEFKLLNTLKQQSPIEILNDQAAEEVAIEEDRRALERKLHQETLAAAKPPARCITLHSMDDVSLESLTYTGDFTRYSEVLRRLIMDRPELEVVDIWIRKVGKHPWTRQWVQVGPLNDIHDQDHDYCDAKNRTFYIVALVNENGVDLPAALDMKRNGEYKECCMPEHCGSLGAHLKNVWPNRMVEYAHKLDAPDQHSDDILDRKFDDNYLLKFTHQLCFRCTPKPKP